MVSGVGKQPLAIAGLLKRRQGALLSEPCSIEILLSVAAHGFLVGRLLHPLPRYFAFLVVRTLHRQAATGTLYVGDFCMGATLYWDCIRWDTLR